jgi:hypothetical protein
VLSENLYDRKVPKAKKIWNNVSDKCIQRFSVMLLARNKEYLNISGIPLKVIILPFLSVLGCL